MNETLENDLRKIGWEISTIKNLMEILSDCFDEHGNTTIVNHLTLFSVIKEKTEELGIAYSKITKELGL